QLHEDADVHAVYDDAVKRAVVGVALLALTGCGGHARPPHRPAPVAAERGYLAPAELRRDLGNGFRAGLDQLPLMSQPVDDSPALATDVPKGLLERVAWSPSGAQPASGAWAWHCSVEWHTARGRAQRTEYAVQLSPARCYAATADPALPQARDTTIATYAEN